MIQDSASKIVPEEVVEAAWLEIEGLSEDQARLHMQRLADDDGCLPTGPLYPHDVLRPVVIECQADLISASP